MVLAQTAVPAYDALPPVADTGERSSWGVFGPDDQLGTINFITPEVVSAAAATVTTGQTFNLSLTLDVPAPALAGERGTYRHHIERTRSGGDDWLDNFYPQGSTQWDGLGHIRFREFGYYNGRNEADLDRGDLGIDLVSEHGLISRGLLLDAAGWSQARRGRPLNPTKRVALTASDIAEILDWQNSEVSPGDVLLVHTGWLTWYAGQSTAERESLRGSLHPRPGGLNAPGLDPSAETAAWLWNHRVAAMAGDTPTVEVLQVRRDEGFLHRRTLALLGMPIGEFWWLHDLAEACRSLGRFHFLLSATPWRLPRGVGSPITPMAVL